MALNAHQKYFTACDICKALRHRAEGDPHKHAIYWPLLQCLRMMLADSKIGTDMVKALKEAREAAAASPVQGLRDWFDGATFRKLVELNYFPSNTCAALRISTDGFQAWKQKGLEGWPTIATVLNVHPSSRVQVMSHLILGITPGPGVFKRSFPQAYPRVFDSGIYPNARSFAFLKLYATRIIPLTEERLNSPQPGIIWTYPCPVIFAKKYAGLIFFSVFYCSLSP